MITKPHARTSSSASSVTPTRKRTHLKPNQLSVLQNSFAVNPLPDAGVRSQLAHDLGVSERTIQIWFQNRRAKARKLEALSNSLAHTTTIQHDPILLPRWMEQARSHSQPRYQPTFRTMMTPERFEELRQQPQATRRSRPRSSSKPEKVEASTPAPTAPQDDIVPLFNIQTLRIGSWSRFTAQPGETVPWDLKCYVQSKFMTWQVLAESHLFRIQVPFDTISQVRLVQEGQLEIELEDPAQCCFSMFSNNEWIRCGDFSEDKQASRENVHVLLGNHDALQQALLDLAALAPELTAKMILTPLPSMIMDDDLVSCSPSVTPEPYLSFPPAATFDKTLWADASYYSPYGF
ncbi:hypothetical protein BJV82DRAFT_606004 [Fennellomyces sp. T-0311]|nr:hypothetical protein BJV82DRAFT_606004 [Fennellomyces sp. T-0311]